MYIIKEMNVIRDTLEDIKIIVYYDEARKATREKRKRKIETKEKT